ncbi:RDD family protein [Streptomyces sp. NPDC048057]|uniref:RDD family protein n=1 Tax=Streptomyces sp. NPDC048057 TaxID=3155628 RepID=UPI0033D8CFB8
MSNDQPPPSGDDPFRKQPPEPSGPGGGEPPQQPPPGPPPPPPQGPPPGSPYGPGQGGGPYGGAGQGGPYGSSAGGTPPPGSPYDQGPYGGGPYGGAPDPLAGMPPLADFGRRFAARVIDALIIFVPLFVISLLVGWGTNGDGSDWDDVANQVNTGRQWLWSLISLVAYVAYDTLMVKKSGQTVGKRLLKLRVAMLSDGSTPDTGASLIRAAVLWVPGLVCCFCVWWLVIIITIIADKPYRQGLHDKAAKTVVVTVPEGPVTRTGDVGTGT